MTDELETPLRRRSSKAPVNPAAARKARAAFHLGEVDSLKFEGVTSVFPHSLQSLCDATLFGLRMVCVFHCTPFPEPLMASV